MSEKQIVDFSVGSGSVSCLSLFEMPTSDFADGLRNRLKDRLPVFMHIPKTAGSSLQRDLQKQFKNGFRVDWEKIDQSWSEFIGRHQQKPFHHVRGHISVKHLDQLKTAGVEFVAFSFLRHPLDRLVSNYTYCISASSPRCVTNRKKYPTLTAFMNENLQPNHMTRLIVGECDSAEQAIERIGADYGFIGLTEFYKLSNEILLPALGGCFETLPRINVTQRDRNFRVTNETVDEILETQAIDLQVFEFFRSRYQELSSRSRLNQAA